MEESLQARVSLEQILSLPELKVPAPQPPSAQKTRAELPHCVKLCDRGGRPHSCLQAIFLEQGKFLIVSYPGPLWLSGEAYRPLLKIVF